MTGLSLGAARGNREGTSAELTASERLIWAGQQLDPSSPLYNMALAIEIAAPLDVAAFCIAFQQLVDETDTLRTSFVESDGRPQRVVREAVAGRVEVLRVPEADVTDAEVAAMLGERTRRAFRLDERLFDSCLIERRADRFIWYINQHHLITDAWSVGVLHRRMSALYEAAVSGAPSGHAPYPQFDAYVAHQVGLRGSPRLSKALEYWDAASAARATSLYGDAAAGSGRTRRVRVRLGPERTAALRAAATAAPFRALTTEQSHFQLFATLLLAWQHRVSDSSSVAIGTPWHNRSTASFRDTAGLFIELFPTRTSVDDGETFASLGAKVARRTLEMIRHVVPGATASPGARGFGVVLNYITARLGDFAGAPTRADWIHSGYGDRDHRVRLQVHDFDIAGTPVLDFDLDETTFGEAETEWAVRHFLALFDALIAEPARAIASVRLTSSPEEAAIAPRGNIADAPGTVLSLVHATMRANPDAVAVRDGWEVVTYAKLEAAARELARRLRDEGVQAESVVGIALDRSAHMVAAMLGVLEAGGAFMPLDPAYPDPRLAFLVRDSGARLVITTAERADRVRAWGATPVIVDSATAPDVSAHLQLDGPAPNALAYVLYTSGSTGQPKGVEVTHASLADYVAWAARQYATEPGLAWPLFTSPSFDLTL
ncbi:MAG TPA: condensation domain-containing protein, partial [Gemmatimonadaceae bacterium]|nr:condensation domain-containing protein [Gemmatimonadaceae bacterium]